jgi:hypothetical protein
MKPTTNGYYWYLSDHRMAKGVVVLVCGFGINAPWVEIPGMEGTCTIESFGAGQWHGPMECPLEHTAAKREIEAASGFASEVERRDFYNRR